ncbi:putative reverse transcriptase domain-containing protein [Tanacetum coccineum]
MKPKSIAQARRNMIKYLKNQGNYKITDFKGMSYNDIRPIFEKIWDFNQNIKPMDAEQGSKKQKSPEKERSTEKIVEEEAVTQGEREEVVKEPATKRKKSIPRKITRKRQKLEEDAEKDELKGFLEIVPREEAPIEVESLSTKFPIVDWKTCVLTETFMYYQVFIGDGSSKKYKVLSEILEDFDRMDVEELFRLVKERYSTSSPEGFDLMLWGDLHTLFEPDKDDKISRDQHEYNLLSWRLCDFCSIHILLMDNGLAIHMLTEKKYLLSQEMLTKMLSRKLEVDHESSQAFELLRFIRSQGRIVRNKSSYDLILPTVLKELVLPAQTDSYSIRRIGSSQYAVSTGQNSTLLYKSIQMTVPFPSRLDNHYCEEEEGNYGPKFTEAYGASHINNAIPRKEKDPGSLGKLAHTKLTVELADRTVKYPKGIAENVLVRICKFTFPIEFVILDMPEDIKLPLILGRPFFSTAHAKIDVHKRKITLRVREERNIFTSVKLASSLIKRVYMLSLSKRMELDLEARLMGETLVRNQGDDLMPTIKEGEVIEEFRTRDADLDTRIDDYPSYCENDKKIHINCIHNLKLSCMIGFEFTHVNFNLLLYVNVMSKKFHNSIMKDNMVYKGDNVVGTLMNVPIFVGTFSVVTDFVVLENMDAYRDEGMGDVIIGEPFLREFGIKARWFDGMITIYNGDDEVTYQMVRSHP